MNKLFDYHEVPKSERPEKKKKLLQLAASAKQLNLPLDPPRLGKSKEELMAEYEEAVRHGPQGRHVRRETLSSKIPGKQRAFVQAQLRALMEVLDAEPEPRERERLERKKQMLLALEA